MDVLDISTNKRLALILNVASLVTTVASALLFSGLVPWVRAGDFSSGFSSTMDLAQV